MATDIEKFHEKADGNGLPTTEGGASPGLVLTGEVFEGNKQSTHRGLKSRHAQMIALGGTIGTGLFVGSGQTLAQGGPALVLGCYCFISFLVFCVITAVVEISTWLPTPGSSMNLFAYRYVSRSLGFALGWLYFYSLGILVPYEITAAAIVIDYWEMPVDINIGVWITIMLVAIVALNALPVRYYGETEFWFAGTKVIMMLGLMLVSVVLFFGGGPSHDRLGFRYWKDPTPTFLASGDTGRFLTLLRTLSLSVAPFAFAAELLVVTGGEMQNPRRNLPIAGRRYVYRLIFFYVGCILCIGVIVPSNDPDLTNGGTGAGSSPFVIGMKRNGIRALDSVVNAGILISAWSAGVPYRCVMASSMFAFLAYINVASSASVVFNWFVNLSNTAGFISWICCGIVYLRFRKAARLQGIEPQLPYRCSWIQPYGTYLQMGAFTFMALINGFYVFWPHNWNVSTFLTAYIGIPLFLAIYFGHRVYCMREAWARDPVEVDLHTGLDEIIAEERPPKAHKSRWGKAFSVFWE
ncbi:Proline-specific permease [Lasiodiplodia theobromae]|uniref:Proline-specific permease n=1 Tax=Lasiodiplodia theobromae TaxID=45133 RepID=A0A5N5D702_9PEZI|nr:Proline-specific permease [Lasiodiplodia theobromae]